MKFYKIALVIFSFLALSMSVSAAQAVKKPFKPYLKVVDTKYTRVCKPVILRAEEEKRVVKGFSDPAFYKRYLKAIDALSNDEFEDATSRFQNLYNRAREGSYERASVAQNFGGMKLQQEDYKGALALLTEAVESKKLPISQDLGMMFNLGLIQSQLSNWDEVIKWTKLYFKTATKAQANVYILMGQAYTSKNEHAKAICAAKNAIEMEDERPDKARFTMVLAGHYNLKDTQGTLAVGKQMVEVYPEVAQYWKQLPQLYSQVGKHTEALAVQDIAYIGGYLDKASEFKNLSAMWAQAAAPYQSAFYRERDIKAGNIESDERNWKFIGGMYRSARSLVEAANAFGEAASFSDTGEHYFTKGDMLSQKEMWKESIEAYTAALQRGGIDGKKTGRAYIARAISKYRIKRYDSALEDLELAMRYKSTKKEAVQWSNFVKNRMKYAGFSS
jgi:tetratricopeptide (TPR) repeat protein